ncbi:glycosyltransferase [Vibrio cyclitrophicus]|uniref:glycosyltransferase n=1 Tax=Vibrio cyclitrophicus TaxID=47951 RepID=UPI000C81D27C|nr:glycosyltransferase [Vibrio cyclitrophicus]PME67312.1 hypothetical protein BCV31_11055 [Vibrio cyclitrophicus]
MLKIAHVVESTATGTLSMVSLSANSLVREGNEVTIIYSRREDTPSNLSDFFHVGVKLIEIKIKPSSLLSIYNIYRAISLINPDIIHCHSSFAGFFTRLATIGHRSKLFYSPHCVSFMRVDISKLKKKLFELVELIACLKRSTYLACSNSEKNALLRAIPFADVILLENAVDLSDFSGARDVSLQPDVKKVITVGGIRPQKGPSELSVLARQFEGKNVEFIWIGDGDNEAKKILADAGVTVTGWKSRENVIKELYSADLYLSTALWEGMPVSLIEACAANLPIVARSCAGNVDVVEHKKTGHLFDSTTEATELIEQFLQDPRPYKQYADTAYNTVFERFSVERFSKELIEIYNS